MTEERNLSDTNEADDDFGEITEALDKIDLRNIEGPDEQMNDLEDPEILEALDKLTLEDLENSTE